MDNDAAYIHFAITDGILICTYKKGLRINLEVAKKIVTERIAFTKGKKVPALILSQGVISMEKPAREYFASTEGIEGLAASAIVVNSAFSSALGNFFLIVNKTKLPVKIFANVRRAEKWLQQYIV